MAPSGSMILMIWKTPWQMEWQHRRISTPARNTNKTSPSCCTTWKRPGGQVIRFIRPSIFLDRTCPRIPRSRLPMDAHGSSFEVTGRVPITSIACTVCNEDNRDLERESLLCCSIPRLRPQTMGTFTALLKMTKTMAVHSALGLTD